MSLHKNMAIWLMVGLLVVTNIIGNNGIITYGVDARKGPTRILVDTDVDTDDYYAILYMLKQNRSELDLKAITLNSNAWCDGGHGVNHIYDILYMMGRDDIDVGVGGEGGILPNGTILPNVGGYLPLVDQGMSTVGRCRYRQAVARGPFGRLDIDTNYGFRRSMLPQGSRRYSPLQQRTVQQVMFDTISTGPTTVLLLGSHTNFALFLMTNPHLRKNVERIYAMGGAIRARNPVGCCSPDNTTCTPAAECGVHGNMFSAYHTNPNAEFNIFFDPFAAYQVMHSGIPLTLVPLDVTNTIPTDEDFFKEFEKQQYTPEAQYCFEGLRINHDIWFNDQFYTSYFMWDSFSAGVLVSTVLKKSKTHKGENEFSEMEYMNITVVTSNKPYGKRDGSNPFFDGRSTPKFNLTKNGVHSGHVQTGIDDPFCIVNGKDLGICEDGYTKEVIGSEAVQVLIATQAKPNKDANSTLRKAFLKSFLDSLNNPENSGSFNFTSQFPYYRETFYKPDFRKRKLGKTVIFDMDMSPGDFISLIYLLKVPVEQIYLKGILVSGNGWANAATIDIVYDILHMMGRDDIEVGLGSVNAKGTPESGCEHLSAIPQGSGGLIDSDTLYGLARDLPRSPRRYTAEKSVEHGAPRTTAKPELRQPLALEIWKSVSRAKANSSHDKITILTTGPLTNLANILHSDDKATTYIERVYIVGGHVSQNKRDGGNIFSVPSNKYAEFNMFLDPLAAKEVFESELNITLVPLKAQRQVASFSSLLKSMKSQSTAESKFIYTLVSLLQKLQKNRKLYDHMDIFMGEMLGVVLLHQQSHLHPFMREKRLTVLTNNEKTKGQITVNQRIRKSVSIVNSVDSKAYYRAFAKLLNAKLQSAVIASFDEQKKQWSKPHIQ